MIGAMSIVGTGRPPGGDEPVVFAADAVRSADRPERETTVDRDPADSRRFVIRPHRSMEMRELAVWFGSIAVCSLAVAVYFYVHGLTLILPFSGLELAALAWGLYLGFRSGETCEIVTVSATEVRVEELDRGRRRRPSLRWTSQRPWTWVILQRPTHDWYPSRLVLRSRGREVEIGRCLTETDRHELGRCLKAAVPVRAVGAQVSPEPA